MLRRAFALLGLERALARLGLKRTPARLGLRRTLALVGRPFGLLKPLLPKGLLARSIMIMLVPLLLVQGTALYVFYDRHYKRVATSLAEAVAGDVAAIVFMLERTQTPAQRNEIFGLARQTMGLLPQFDELSLPLGLPATSNNPGEMERRLSRALSRQGWRYSIDSRSQPGEAIIAVDLPQLDGSLMVAVDKSRLFTSTNYIFAFWLLGASVILFGVAIIFLRNQVRPIRRLANAADSYGQGNYKRGQAADDIPLQGATEVRLATLSFLRMRKRIDRFVEQRTAMLSGVSHDLRTPLTRMKLQLALLADGEDRSALEHDVREMERMVEGYLAFARGEGTEAPEAFDLCTVLRAAANAFELQGQAVPLNGLPAQQIITGKPDALRRCFDNLIGNALKYGSGQVAVSFEGRERVRIHIDDDGPGIPAADRDRIFEPFFRTEQSRNSDTGGLGLGLAIARDIIRDHGGSLVVSAAPELGGARFTILLGG